MNAKIMQHDIEAGVRNGFWFFFDVDGHQVSVHNSALSGRERVWVDDELVVNRLSWSKYSEHTVDVGGRAVEVAIALPSLKTPRMTCTLSHAGEQIACAEKEIKPGGPVSIWMIAASVLLGMAAGYFGVRLVTALLGVE